jgi:hopanoid biosynthesis associated protein HpnK
VSAKTRRAGHAKRVIFTADDFGLAKAVNTAVELGHQQGVLTTASLMVGAPAAADAVKRARANPGLKIGLHLVLADGEPVLPPAAIPDLVGADGRFRAGMGRAGARFFFLPRVRRQLAAEIRAQFEAFARFGLPLDHLNAHKHFHLHPTVLSLVLRIGREYGLRAVRLPHEPLSPALERSRRDMLVRIGWWVFLAPWMWLVKTKLQHAALVYNERLFGLSHTGNMNEAAVLGILDRLPAGTSELYFHPATATGLTDSMRGYQHTRELEALLSPRVAAALDARGITKISFSDVNN